MNGQPNTRLDVRMIVAIGLFLVGMAVLAYLGIQDDAGVGAAP